MSDLYYRNRRLLVLTIALIIVAGSAAYDSLPRLEAPELVARNSIVTTRVPGGDAERVESLVTEKIEDELFDIEEIKTLESTSRAGISIIEVELDDEVTDTNEVWSRIRDKLDDVEPELPADALEPELEETDVRGYTMIAALTWQRDGLTVDDVAAQIGRSDSKVSAGLMRNSLAGDVLIEVEGELDSLDRIRRTPVSYGSDGQFVQLSDIASIDKGIRRPSTDLALVAGRPAVTVAAFVKSDYRVDRWAHITRAEVAQFADQLPTGVGLEVVFDQSRYTEQRLSSLLSNLLSNLALGAAAVVVVLLLMMGWRSALIVSLSLPLSSLMVLAGINFLDIPLHQMSVTGLIIVWLGIGAVV
jgi:multidrug efflux pump subunit AcrB